MTQPAKGQEPSMEEILASIRRIIADEEPKPPVPKNPAAAVTPVKPEKPAAPGPAARPAPAKDIAPTAAPAPPKAAAPARPASVAVSPPAAPAVSNSQNDIDALLNGLDEATSPDQIRPPAPDPEV